MKLVENRDKDYHFCDFIVAKAGNAKLVRDAYGKAAHKLKFSDGRLFKPLAIEILRLAAIRERLGSVTVESIPVVGRSLPIAKLSTEQIFARFAYVQRALGSLLDIGIMDQNPLVYGTLQASNLSIAVSDPQEVCEFLISFLQATPDYDHDEVLIQQLQQHLTNRLQT